MARQSTLQVEYREVRDIKNLRGGIFIFKIFQGLILVEVRGNQVFVLSSEAELSCAEPKKNSVYGEKSFGSLLETVGPFSLSISHGEKKTREQLRFFSHIGFDFCATLIIALLEMNLCICRYSSFVDTLIH